MDTMIYLKLYDNFSKEHPFNEKIGVRQMQSYANGFPYKKAVKAAREVAKIAAEQCKKAHTMQVISPYSPKWELPTYINGMPAKEWYEKNKLIIEQVCSKKHYYSCYVSTNNCAWNYKYKAFIHNIYKYLHDAWFGEQSKIRDDAWNAHLADMRKQQQKAREKYLKRLSEMTPEEQMWKQVRSAF